MTTTRKRSQRTYQGPSPEESMANDLIALMESSDLPPWRKDWSGEYGQHRNLLTGEHYRGANPILLELGAIARGSLLPLWCGGAQAKGRGWFPRKGSKCVRIVRPQLNQRTTTDDEGNPVKGPDGEPMVSAWVSYRAVAVFNAADLTGYGEEEERSLRQQIDAATAVRDPVVCSARRCEAAERVLEDWPVRASWDGTVAAYLPADDRIVLPPRRLFATEEGRLATWAHEQIHSTGHKSRLNRVLETDKSSADYAREELIAELGAVLVCYRLGISTNFENHAAYLKTWAEILQESPKVLLKVLSEARGAADLVAPESIAESE